MKLQKNRLSWVALLSLVLILGACSSEPKSAPASSVQQTETVITLNGEKLENTGLIHKHNTMYIPASFVTDVLGAEFVPPTSDMIEKANEQYEEGVYYRNKVGVLMYHAIMDIPEKDSIISTEQFREHLRWLKDEGFQPISIEQYTEFLHNEGEVPDNAVLITFDDGYENFYTYAYPALKEFNYPAVNFVIVSGVDDPSIPGMKKLSWDQMREMKQHNIAFHNHTYSLHEYGAVDAAGTKLPLAISRLYISEENRAETDEEYTARVTEDLRKAEERLKEELDNTLSVIAFPYGAYNDQLLSICQSLGIDTSFTVVEGINTSEDKNGYRINGGRSDMTAEELLSPLKPKPLEYNGKVMLLNGKLISFSKVLEQEEEQSALYPLREVSNELGVFVGFSKASNTVNLVY